MSFKKIVCVAAMHLPMLAMAQQGKGTAGKPLAEATEMPALTSESLVAKKPEGLNATPGKATTLSAKSEAAVIPQAARKLTERSRKETGDQYIPLAGEIEYFGKNNDYILAYTKNYYQKNFRHFATMQQRGQKYFKIIDRTFDKREVPLEMKYLSVIESALTNRALSKVGALGPWQFMPGTGQFMGLVVNERVDERTDWNKSTNAAAKYVNYLYDMLGDWLLVVAAYNSGPKPVLSAIKKTGNADFFAIKKYLPAETQNHVMAFVATATVMERMNNYIGAPVPADFDWKSLNIQPGKSSDGITPAKPKNPLLLRFSEDELKGMAIVKVGSPIDLDVLAATLGEDRRKIGRWNFDYYQSLGAFKSGTAKNFLVRIPKEKLELFLEKKGFIEKHKVDLNAFE
ncbi:MAG: transglycosylase SLT domain-containing protein [Taibaiella sp.]|nr:transglycosylase SLT domain-containing protein [Taibaiella sp.]